MLELLAAAAIAACAIPAGIVPAPPLAPEESRIVPVEHLVLAFYWWPQECRRPDADSAGCRAGFGLRVHGLWPDGAGSTYPQFCRAAPPLDLAEVRRNWCLTPSPSLLEHEWAKHGTCHWSDAATYFTAERRVAATIVLPDLDRPPVASAGAVRDAMLAANPALPRGAIFVGTDRNQWLTEVRVCLDVAEHPAACTAGTGAGDSVPLRVGRASDSRAGWPGGASFRAAPPPAIGSSRLRVASPNACRPPVATRRRGCFNGGAAGWPHSFCRAGSSMSQGGGAFYRAADAVRRRFSTATAKQGTTTQIMAIGGAALIVGWLGIATTNLVTGQSAAVAAKSAELARLQAQLVAMKSSTTALKGEVADRAAAIEKRQAFLAALLTPKHDLVQLAALLPRSGDVATARAMLPAGTATGDGLMAPFRKLEADQLAFVDRATGAADARLRDTQSLLRRLGLDPDRLVAASAFDAAGATAGVGGPYLPVSAPADAEPKFKSLFLSWKKLQALEAALTVVPSYMPVRGFSYSSGFGVRFDPFTGMSAMHAGVDMAGRQGDPVYAAASGTVSLAGWAGAYGNCVEVAHGRGLATRYGHLSAILVRAGQAVHQGDVIARMGSTGHSTGTHLHFEVRIDGRAVNPRPYLDASDYVLAAQHRAGDAVGPGFAASDSAL